MRGGRGIRDGVLCISMMGLVIRNEERLMRERGGESFYMGLWDFGNMCSKAFDGVGAGLLALFGVLVRRNLEDEHQIPFL